jgi:hypothetical protein
MTLEQGCARLQPVGNEADADKASLELGSEAQKPLQQWPELQVTAAHLSGEVQ